MVDREYGKPDFPIVSDPFDNPNIPPFISTEIDPAIDLSTQDIFDLGFLRSNPSKKIYQHNLKTDIFLEEFYEYDYSVKDRVVRRVVITEKKELPTISKVIYNSTKPNKEDIAKLL